MSASTTGKKTCKKGKSCGSTCVAANKTCKMELRAEVQSPLSKIRDLVREKGLGIAEHGVKGVAAWKAGKLLAPAISGYLESHYGIPREASSQLAETVIQAVTATALEMSHLKDANSFVKKLLVETAAAYAGKAAHGGVESAVEAAEARQWIQNAAPLLAGKVTGISTAIAGGKMPPASQLVKGVIERSRADTNKLLDMLRPRQLGFAEGEDQGVAELLADLVVAALMIAHG
jgi:hypothetical protein